MVPCGAHVARSGSQAHHPSKNSVQKTICCNSTSNAPDDGRTYPKHFELRIHQYNYVVASSWHFTLFHEEDARSNNHQKELRRTLKHEINFKILNLLLLDLFVFLQPLTPHLATEDHVVTERDSWGSNPIPCHEGRGK